MDHLEEELSKLTILPNRSAQQNTQKLLRDSSVGYNKVSELTNSFQLPATQNVKKERQENELQSGYIYQNTRDISPKKIGPVVPPKPLKNKDIYPEVPKSIIVEKTCEPLYSQRLQDSIAVERPPLLQRKQPLYAIQKSLYDKTNKFTLDNPVVLEQQLEALAHHKKQLEKKGLLLQQQDKQTILGGISCIPKLSSTSLINDRLYSNIRSMSQLADDKIKPEGVVSNVYSNVETKTFIPNEQTIDINGQNNIYSNLNYKKNIADDMVLSSPSPALTITTTELKSMNDTEEPSPPSPVSSSYSELRRATDVYHKKQFFEFKQNGGFSNERSLYYDENRVDSNKGNIGNDLPQMYSNLKYSNEYGCYSPTFQNANKETTDYYVCGDFSQNSSTYESIYEPINPRPHSQLSARSNYLMYAPYVNGPSVSEDGSITQICPSSGNAKDMFRQIKSNHQKENDVETLTDMLVHSMDSAGDVDSYGICFKCNERVVGENSGCTAMDQIYHIACFTCYQCQINLQGKPFYALEGRPYCEYDYLQTLEKCSVCMKPILERILRATGKPYHPQCFTCVVCGNSLDGIPFTVDATNQNYCIEDFHKKFAPRCCVCKEPIMPEPGEEETVRVVALDRSFHFECYKCEDCGLLLSSEADGRGCYPLDDHVLCKNCNAKRVRMLTDRMTTEL